MSIGDTPLLRNVIRAWRLQRTGSMRDWIVQLERRTKAFAERTHGLCDELPGTTSVRTIASQLARASGSVAANHRAARRARSDEELASKLQIVSEEVDECVLWFELLDGKHVSHQARIDELLDEARQLRAIFGRSLATLRRRIRDKRLRRRAR